jgi:hypothetical protein
MTILLRCGASLEIYGAVPPIGSGEAATFTFTAAGGEAPYVFTLTASELDAGEWTFTDNGDGTASLTTADAVTTGDFDFTIRVTDAARTPADASYSLRVVAQPLRWDGVLPDFAAGVPYSADLDIVGGVPPYTVPFIAGLPDGIGYSLVGSVFTISGTPTGAGFGPGYSQSVDIFLQAEDATAVAAAVFEQTVPLTITPLELTGVLPGATEGVAYNQSLTRVGGVSPFAYTLAPGSGPLPTGLALSPSAPTVSGTPTVADTYPFTVRVTDANGNVDDSPAQSITVAAAPDAYFSSVVVLQEFEGANNSTVFTDAIAGRTWVAGDNAKLSTAAPLAGVSSLTLDGTNDYAQITSASNKVFDFGSADFCIEGLANQTTLSAGVTRTVASRWNSAGGNQGFVFNAVGRDAELAVSIDGNFSATYYLYATNALPVAGTTFHWAIVRIGTVIHLCIDGVSVGTPIPIAALRVYGSALEFTVGATRTFGQFFNGKHDNVRVTRANSRYAIPFTPPTSLKLTGPTNGDYLWNYVASRLHFNGANGSTVMTDATGKAWTAHGNAQIDTSQSVFGGASLKLDGTGDYIKTASHANFDLGNRPFTISFRIRLGAVGADRWIFVRRNSNADYAQIGMLVTAANRLRVVGAIANTAYNIDFTSTTALSINTWYAVTLERTSNGVFTTYLNGVADGTQTNDVTLKTMNEQFTIGAGDASGAAPQGFFHMDEWDFVVKIPRYAAAYTVPVAAFVDQYPV